MAKTMEEVLERFRTIEFHDDFDMTKVSHPLKH